MTTFAGTRYVPRALSTQKVMAQTHFSVFRAHETCLVAAFVISPAEGHHRYHHETCAYYNKTRAALQCPCGCTKQNKTVHTCCIISCVRLSGLS